MRKGILDLDVHILKSQWYLKLEEENFVFTPWYQSSFHFSNDIKKKFN